MNRFLPHIVAGILGFTAAVLSPDAYAAVCGEDRDMNSCLSGSDPIASCTRALQKDRRNASIRLSLCQAYVQQSDLEKARAVIEEGLTSCSRRRCADFRLAESNVRELQQRAARAAAQPDASETMSRAYCSGPIANSRSISACKDLLRSNRGDTAITESLADKLLSTNEPTQALSYLKRARSLSTRGRALLAQAKSERKSGVSRCLQGSSLSLCNMVLLPGESDELQVQRKRGELLAAQGNFADAFAALQASAALGPGDRTTAELITALDPSGFAADDLAYLNSVAAAHRLLDNTDAERAVLQQLVDLEPGNASATARLAELKPPADATAVVAEEPVVVKAEPEPRAIVNEPTVALQEPRRKQPQPVVQNVEPETGRTRARPR